MWIKEMVEGIIEEFQTRDVFEIIKALDITLVRQPLSKNKKGRFFRDSYGNEIITLSNNLNEYEEIAIAAHELGHAILHTNPNTSYYTTDLVPMCKIELQANKFAAELLIPDKEILNFSSYNNITIDDLSCIYRVPKEYIKLKFDSNYCSQEMNQNEFDIDFF